ncbi:type IV pilin-like G/H family protein [Myxosarcina sp. GI1(2024)]
MNKLLKSIKPLIPVSFGVSILGLATFGLTVVTQAQVETPSSSQQLPVKPVAKMIYGQTAFYKENGEFIEEVYELRSYLQQNFDMELPSNTDYDISTTEEASYNYVIPKSNSSRSQVGALFISPQETGKLMRIICQNNNPGAEPPAAPKLIRDILDPSNVSMQCGENSFQNLLFNE